MKLLKSLMAIALVIAPLNPANAAKISWYGCRHIKCRINGHRTANGERFDQNAFTAASRNLPFGTKLLLTYKGRTVIVRVNDRGPYIKGRKLDVSKAAAKSLRCPDICNVKIKKYKINQ